MKDLGGLPHLCQKVFLERPGAGLEQPGVSLERQRSEIREIKACRLKTGSVNIKLRIAAQAVTKYFILYLCYLTSFTSTYYREVSLPRHDLVQKLAPRMASCCILFFGTPGKTEMLCFVAPCPTFGAGPLS